MFLPPPWPVRIFAVFCVVGFLAGIAALIAQPTVLTLHPELPVGPGRGGFLDGVLGATSAGTVFYFGGIVVSVVFAREPRPRYRWWMVSWGVVLVAVELFTEFSRVDPSGNTNLFALAWAVVIPFALIALCPLPSVDAYIHTHRELQPPGRP